MIEKKKISFYAIMCFVFGIIGIVIGFWLYGLIGIACGEKFRRLNKAAGGQLKGKSIAIIGTILGVISFLMPLILVAIKRISSL